MAGYSCMTDLSKVPKNQNSGILAFFGMELDAQSRTFPDNGRKCFLIVCYTDHVFLWGIPNMIGMDEIELRRIRQILPYRMMPQKTDLVPSDMGNLPEIRRKRDNSSGKKAQTFMGAELFPNFEKKLQTETDPKERPSPLGPFPQERDKSALLQMAHAFAESADSRQNNPFRRKSFRW